MKKKKKLWFTLLALFLLYSGWLGYHVLRYKHYTFAPSSGFSPEIKGVYHLHTKYSAGFKTSDQIAHLASKASLDFIILTDHGNPNYKCLESQGWKEGVLVLAGSELSVNRGHLVALGFNLPLRNFSPVAEEAVSQINSLNGFSIIVHPYSKTPWSWGKWVDYSGLEIMNADTMLRNKFYLWLPYFPALLVKPELVLLKILNPPFKNLHQWDRLNQVHSLYGYYSSDAHFLYGPLLSFMTIHIPVQEPLSSDFEEAKAQVYESLKKGRFFNVVEAAAEASGFRFWAQKGDKTFYMGSNLSSWPAQLHVCAPFPFAQETNLIHNSQTILNSTEDHISYLATQPGVYRVEVYLKESTPLGKRIPWILSNPIFFRRKD